VLQRALVYRIVQQCVVQCVAGYCSVLQCAIVYRSVQQCVLQW